MKKLRSSILAGGGVIAVMLAVALLVRQCTAPDTGAVQPVASLSADRHSAASAYR